MNIIEREIALRQAKIDEHDDKLNAIEEHKKAIAVLEAEVNDFDLATLEAEIAELKTYLPKPEVDETVVVEDGIAEDTAE